MGLYITLEDVKVRLAKKVRFTENPDHDDDAMPVALAKRLINEAEGQVEQVLSQRYAAPFQTQAGQPFRCLPERPTKEILRTLCELKAVMRILETDFGSGTAVDGSKYMENLEKRYKAIVEELLERKEDDVKSYINWKRPPLPGLMLAAHNELTDDGYSGEVVHVTDGRGGYAADQVNDPSQSFWHATLDDMLE